MSSPRLSRLTPAAESDRSPRARLVPATVLVVEDNADHADLVDLMLAQARGRPWQIEHAADLQGALRRVRRKGVDVVLLDLNLPDSRGLDTVARFCASAPDLPVVVATSTDDEELGVVAIHSGAQDYLKKGQFDPAALNRTLRLAMERKQGELAASRLAAIVENSDDAIVGHDLEGIVRTWNAGATRIYGYASEEMLGRSIGVLFPRERLQEASDVLRRVGDGEHVLAYDAAQVTKAGVTIMVSLTVSPVLGSGGMTTGASFIARDVTGRKRMEEALRASERRLQAIIDSEPECVKVVGLDGVILDMNPAGLAMVEATRKEDVVGRALIDFIHPEDRAAYSCLVSETSGGGSCVFRMVGLKGAVRWMESQTVPLYDDSGRVASILGVTRDVTAHRNTEEALRESERRYRLLFEESPQPMWVYDLSTLRFLAVNDAACRHYGYSREEFLAMTMAALRPSEDLADVRSEVAKVDGGPRLKQLRRHLRKDGTLIEVEVDTYSIAFGESPARLVQITDITDRRRLEEQFRQAQKMEAVGRLAGGVAHDFNNVLGVILGYAELIRRGARPGEPLWERVDEILKAAGRASDLTRQLLAFSRKQVLQSRVLDLNVVAGEMERMLQRLIGEDIRLVTSFAPDLGRVMADPGQVSQIIVNLAVNARDAMPEGGTLILETANVDLDHSYVNEHAEARLGRHVMLAVSDTGTGMTPEVKARIFEPFFTTKEEGKGTGLGLATVYGIVRQSGGHINVYSEAGRGTTFKIYLPRVEEAAEVATADLGKPPGGTETILVVEDDEALREIVSELLREAGYRVIVAAHGEEALGVGAQNGGPPDLVITDVVMPRMTGRALSEQLRALGPRLRVLFMSGYTDAAVLYQGLLEPGTAFLQKPFGPEALLRKVREVLDQPRPAPQP
jgi:two-component system cell cycle sensor histidine kinase/response regulator CckA